MPTTSDNQTVEKKKRSGKYTFLFTLLAIALLGMAAIVVMTLVSTDIDGIDGSKAIQIDQYLNSKKYHFIVWRALLYAGLLSSFYFMLRRKDKIKHAEKHIDKKEDRKRATIRMAMYVLLFELVIVQNLLNKLFSMFS